MIDRKRGTRRYTVFSENARLLEQTSLVSNGLETMLNEDCKTVDCIETRTRRALEECMTVLPNKGRAADARGLFVVVGENENGEYLVDIHGGTCECPDSKYNNNHCKHQRRCEILNQQETIPADALGEVQIDTTFGAHVDTTPLFATADGGIINGETGEEIDDTTEETTETEENVWSPPRPEIDPFGNHTGFDIVECTSCEVETIVPLKDTASHKEHCKYE